MVGVVGSSPIAPTRNGIRTRAWRQRQALCLVRCESRRCLPPQARDLGGPRETPSVRPDRSRDHGARVAVVVQARCKPHSRAPAASAELAQRGGLQALPSHAQRCRLNSLPFQHLAGKQKPGSPTLGKPAAACRCAASARFIFGCAASGRWQRRCHDAAQCASRAVRVVRHAASLLGVQRWSMVPPWPRQPGCEVTQAAVRPADRRRPARAAAGSR